MTSFQERIKLLENDLSSDPIKISAYHDLPFAIFCYDPKDEYPLRREINLLATRLENKGKKVVNISLGRLMWECIDSSRGVSYLIQTEKRFGFNKAQETANNILSKLSPLPDMIVEKMKGLDPNKHIVFLTRAEALAPAIYRMSKLLDEMHGRTEVPIILFYPGEKQGETELRFMGIEGREGVSGYNYRVKIY